MNVVLIGMPGSGKSVVAKELGVITDRKVIDTDEVIVTNHGEINEIFKSFGEQVFRSIESKIIESVCELDNVIISTGGGCIRYEKNVSLLKACGKVIYLQARIETLYNRTVNDDSRPLIAGEKMKKLKNLLSVRAPLYESSADFIIATDDLTPVEIAEKIAELIK